MRSQNRAWNVWDENRKAQKQDEAGIIGWSGPPCTWLMGYVPGRYIGAFPIKPNVPPKEVKLLSDMLDGKVVVETKIP